MKIFHRHIFFIIRLNSNAAFVFISLPGSPVMCEMNKSSSSFIHVTFSQIESCVHLHNPEWKCTLPSITGQILSKSQLSDAKVSHHTFCLIFFSMLLCSIAAFLFFCKYNRNMDEQTNDRTNVGGERIWTEMLKKNHQPSVMHKTPFPQ